ncbi:hypothetical protein [Natronorubrum texcoconense]|uniref:Uncharacterized protein n=1 Tax=Natronorubrum texcoconense TaxID=1095776 RepID=A0A1G8VSD3_9EURY|nr:hypothetical protein [Natronorubrum texcoconense]SDJ68120.1 hypothetical protein SAMN04515672_1449 [Natronorubrum texcoconense]
MRMAETDIDIHIIHVSTYDVAFVDPYFPQRWSEHCDRLELNPTIAWLEAYDRLVTCIRLEDRPRDEQQYIRDLCL